MNQPVLSICIPTFNRANYLDGLLNNIFEQDFEYPFYDEFEIVIVDGCSYDDTENTVKRFLNKKIKIIYYRRSSNVGIDADILKSIELANGIYCWFFSDDDRMYNGAIKYLLEKLKQDKELSGCFCNRKSYDSTMKYMVAELKSWPHQILKKDFLFRDKASCFSVLGMDLGFISSQIVNRELWQKIINKNRNDLKEYYNFYLMVHIIGLMMNENCKWLYIDKPIIKQRTANDSILSRGGFYGGQKIEHEAFAKIVGSHFPVNSKVYKKFFKKMVQRLPRVVANMKSFNPSYKIQFQVLRLYIKMYNIFITFWLKVFPLFLFPNFLFKIIKLLYFKSIQFLNPQKS